MIVHAFLLDAHPQSPSILGLRDDAQHDAVRWHGRALPQRYRVRRVRFLKVYRILAWPSAAWLAMLWGALTGFPVAAAGRSLSSPKASRFAGLACMRYAVEGIKLGSVLKPGLLWCCKLNHHGGHTGKGC
jgi:hypothetical protein